MGNNFQTNRLGFNNMNKGLGSTSDANSNIKESKMNMAVLELMRTNHQLNILNIIRKKVFRGDYSRLMDYFTELQVIYYEWSGLIFESFGNEFDKLFNEASAKHDDYQYAIENDEIERSKIVGNECLNLLKNIDLKLMEMKQKLKMGMPTKEGYSVNDRVFRDLEANRNLFAIILKRFKFDKKYQATFEKWAEEDKEKKLSTMSPDDDFSEFDEFDEES